MIVHQLIIGGGSRLRRVSSVAHARALHASGWHFGKSAGQEGRYRHRKFG